MGFLIGILTVVMVLDCAVLIFLVLIQLPKKDAGAGLAFGGGATDALFGAGTGNVLTKITKYAAATFFILSVGLSVMQGYYHNRTTSVFEKKLQQTSPATTTQPGTSSSTPKSPATEPAAVPATNPLTVTPPTAESPSLPVAVPPDPAPTTTPKK